MRRSLLTVQLGIIGVVFPVLVFAAIVHVPTDQPTIQAGIDAASSGDTVLVAAGTYDEWEIQLKNGIHILGEVGDPEDVVLSGTHSGTVLLGENLDHTTIVESISISNGYALSAHGGGIYLENSSPTFINLIIRDNIAGGGDGGGLYCKSLNGDCSPTLTDVRFLNNEAFSSGGGCFFMAHQTDGSNHSYCRPHLDLVVFQENHAGGHGGALGLWALDSYQASERGAYCEPTIQNAQFLDNSSVLDGGAIYGMADTSNDHTDYRSFLSPVLELVEVRSNTSEGNGGGVFLATSNDPGSYCNPVFRDIELSRNTSSAYGGGAYLSVEGTITSLSWIGGLVERNQSGDEGGGIYISCEGGSTPDLQYLTVVDNDAGSQGSGIMGTGPIWLKQSLIAFNSGPGGGLHGYQSDISVICCDLFGNETTEFGGDIPDPIGVMGTISEDPLFCDFVNGLYTVDETSPCLPANNDCQIQMGCFGEGCVDSPFSIDIQVVGPAEDIGNVLGVQLGATDGYDADLDFPETPPAPTDFVSLYFPHPEWESPFGDNFTSDIRAATRFEETQLIWDFTIETDLLDEDFELNCIPSPAWDDSLPAFLYDLDTGDYFDVRQDTVEISSLNGLRNFTMAVGPKSGTDHITSALPSGWNLISLPLHPATWNVSDNFDTQIADPYYVYGYDETGLFYFNPLSFELNKGYWLGLNTTEELDFVGTRILQSSRTCGNTGWKLMGTQLAEDVLLSSVQVQVDETLYSWQDAVAAEIVTPLVYFYDTLIESYAVTDTLRSGSGFWVGQLDSLVQYRFDLIPSPPEPISSDSEEAWWVDLVVETENCTVGTLGFGVHPEASAGYDSEFDIPSPPRGPNPPVLEAYFDHPEWMCPLGSKFMRDIGPIWDEEQRVEWTLYVSMENFEARICWPSWSESVPIEYRFILDDLRTPFAENVDMRSQESYTLLGAGDHALRISLYIDSLTDTAPSTPRRTELLASHPNPFNPKTKINFAIAEAGEVDLAIYDISGRLIRDLANIAYKVGYHSEIWDGTDNNNHAVSSGVYLVSLRVPQTEHSQQIVLLK